MSSELAVWCLAVLTIAWILTRFIVRAPRLRAMLILTAFACTLVPFAMSQFPTRVPVTPAIKPAPRQVQTATIPAAPLPAESGRIEDSEGPAEGLSIPWTSLLIGAWLIGAMAGWTALLIAIVRMNRFAAAGRTSTPLVAGFPKARILLPADWPGDLSADEADAALRHEESHLRHKHIAGRIFAESFRRWLWWIPFSHLIVRIYDQSLEEIADADAVKSHPPAILASALLKAAGTDQYPHLCSGANMPGNDLEFRIRNIMKNRSPGRLSAALLLSFAAIAAAVGLSPRPSTTLEASFGLQTGAKWTYRIDYPMQKGPKNAAFYTQLVDRVTAETAQTVYQLRTELTEPVSLRGSSPPPNAAEMGYSYQAIRKDGLYRLHNRLMRGPGYDSSWPDPLMKGPFKVGSEWKWRAPFRGQTATGPGAKMPNLDDLAQDCTARIAAEEDVKVDAGTFRSFKVRLKKVSKAGSTSDETHWYSLERGLLKSIIQEKGQVVATWTLTKYELAQGQPEPEKSNMVNVEGLEEDLNGAKLELISRETYESLRVPPGDPSRLDYRATMPVTTAAVKPGEAAYLLARDFPYIRDNTIGRDAQKQSPPVYVNFSIVGTSVRKNMTMESQQFNRPHEAPLTISRLNRQDGFSAFAIHVAKDAPAQDVKVEVTLSCRAWTNRKPVSVSPPGCRLTFRVSP